MDQTLADFLLGLATNFVFQVLAVLFAIFIWDRFINPWFYGGSTVRVIWNDHKYEPRQISWRTAKEIAEDDSDLSVFLKGVVSPYLWLNCDLVSDGLRNGMLSMQKVRQKRFGQRVDYTITLDYNPPAIPYRDWRARIIKDGQEVNNIALSPHNVQQLKNKSSEPWQFLVKLAAPYATVLVPTVAEATDLGLLAISDEKKDKEKFVTVDLDRNPGTEQIEA